MTKAIIIVIAIAAIVGIIVMYNNANTSPDATMPAGEEGAEGMPQNGMVGGDAMDEGDVSAVKTFIVSGENFSFAPSNITVKKGDQVSITFKNVSGFHDFKIDEFNVATKQIQGGQEETVTFTADKTGTFEYYCSVGNHRTMGMVGTLVVQ